jgi:hypothetical protein
MPICTNISRAVWNWVRPLNAGDAICLPCRLLLPCSQVRTSLRMNVESLRSSKKRSLLSIRTWLLKRSLVMAGFCGETSVGKTGDSSRTKRLVLDASRGIRLATRTSGRAHAARRT